MTRSLTEPQGRADSEGPHLQDLNFTLPVGYLDAAGRLHRQGQMRLATAFDEIEPLGDPRVKDNEAFFGLLLFSRVVVRLGDFSPVPLEVVAGLYAADFAYLQSLYIEVNSLQGGTTALRSVSPVWSTPEPARGSIETSCPQCGAELILDLDPVT